MAERLEVTPLGDGRYRVSDGASHCIAYAVRAGSERWIFIEGMVFVVPTTDARSGRPRATNDDVALASPMPATVSLINVKPGDQVAAGDVLVMLEAMKMELPIKATRAARVKAVHCRTGERVLPGVPLLELE